MSQLQTKGNTALGVTVLLTRVFLNVFLNLFAREAQWPFYPLLCLPRCTKQSRWYHVRNCLPQQQTAAPFLSSLPSLQFHRKRPTGNLIFSVLHFSERVGLGTVWRRCISIMSAAALGSHLYWTTTTPQGWHRHLDHITTGQGNGPASGQKSGRGEKCLCRWLPLPMSWEGHVNKQLSTILTWRAFAELQLLVLVLWSTLRLSKEAFITLVLNTKLPSHGDWFPINTWYHTNTANRLLFVAAVFKTGSYYVALADLELTL